MIKLILKILGGCFGVFCELVGWQGVQTPRESVQTPPATPPAVASTPAAASSTVETGKTDTATVQTPEQIETPIGLQIFGPGLWLEDALGNRAFDPRDGAPVHVIKAEDVGVPRVDGVTAHDMTPAEAQGRIGQHQTYVHHTKQRADSAFADSLVELGRELTSRAESLLPKYREAHQKEADKREITLVEVEAEFVKIAVDQGLSYAVRLYAGEEKERLLKHAFDRLLGPPKAVETILINSPKARSGKPLTDHQGNF